MGLLLRSRLSYHNLWGRWRMRRYIGKRPSPWCLILLLQLLSRYRRSRRLMNWEIDQSLAHRVFVLLSFLLFVLLLAWVNPMPVHFKQHFRIHKSIRSQSVIASSHLVHFEQHCCHALVTHELLCLGQPRLDPGKLGFQLPVEDKLTHDYLKMVVGPGCARYCFDHFGEDWAQVRVGNVAECRVELR